MSSIDPLSFTTGLFCFAIFLFLKGDGLYCYAFALGAPAPLLLLAKTAYLFKYALYTASVRLVYG